jgi:hypothetical protein
MGEDSCRSVFVLGGQKGCGLVFHRVYVLLRQTHQGNLELMVEQQSVSILAVHTVMMRQSCLPSPS